MGTQTPITVIGLGPMGQAMAHSFLREGHPVTVWNRTPARAEPLTRAGAKLADDPGQALDAGELVILSLTDYAAMWDVLGEHEQHMGGRTLVNLSSDTPSSTRAAARWAAELGADFLTGGIMVPAPMVGTDLSYVYYSGARGTFERCEQTLATIGAPRYLGEDPGQAQVMYQAQLGLFLTTLAGFAHAAALAGAAGITARELVPEAMQLFTAIPAMIAPEGPEEMGRLIDAGQHPGEGSSNRMMAATSDHIVATARALHVESALPEVVQDLFHRTLEAGWGHEGWTRFVPLMRAEVR